MDVSGRHLRKILKFTQMVRIGSSAETSRRMARGPRRHTRNVRRMARSRCQPLSTPRAGYPDLRVRVSSTAGIVAMAEPTSTTSVLAGSVLAGSGGYGRPLGRHRMAVRAVPGVSRRDEHRQTEDETSRAPQQRPAGQDAPVGPVTPTALIGGAGVARRRAGEVVPQQDRTSRGGGWNSPPGATDDGLASERRTCAGHVMYLRTARSGRAASRVGPAHSRTPPI